MNNHRANREDVEFRRDQFPAHSLRALWSFILFLICTFSFAQINNDKQPYAQNDPRNPDCPCHKYQKMADDEYKKLNNKDHMNEVNFVQKNLDENKNKNIGIDHSSHANVNETISQVKPSAGNSSTGSHNRSKKKRSFLWISKKIWRTKIKYSGIKKLKPDYSVCYKW